jgi:hypothetical protein
MSRQYMHAFLHALGLLDGDLRDRDRAGETGCGVRADGRDTARAPTRAAVTAALCRLPPDTTVPHSSSLTAGGFHCRSAGSSAASYTRVPGRILRTSLATVLHTQMCYIRSDRAAGAAGGAIPAGEVRSRRTYGAPSQVAGDVAHSHHEVEVVFDEHRGDASVQRRRQATTEHAAPLESSPAADSSSRSSRGCPRRFRGAAGWGTPTPERGFMTGQVFRVDGGQVMMRQASAS